MAGKNAEPLPMWARVANFYTNAFTGLLLGWLTVMAYLYASTSHCHQTWVGPTYDCAAGVTIIWTVFFVVLLVILRYDDGESGFGHGHWGVWGS